PLADRRLEALEEAFGVDGGRLRQHDRELVAANTARDVRRADDVANPLGGLGEHPVTREVAYAVVDRLEVVEVEHDQRQLAAVAVRTGDLARQRLVEVAAVVQPGERVDVGELPRLAEAPRIVDRGPSPLRELLERPESALVERVRSRARVAGQPPELLALG